MRNKIFFAIFSLVVLTSCCGDFLMQPVPTTRYYYVYPQRPLVVYDRYYYNRPRYRHHRPPRPYIRHFRGPVREFGGRDRQPIGINRNNAIEGKFQKNR